MTQVYPAVICEIRRISGVSSSAERPRDVAAKVTKAIKGRAAVAGPSRCHRPDGRQDATTRSADLHGGAVTVVKGPAGWIGWRAPKTAAPKVTKHRARSALDDVGEPVHTEEQTGDGNDEHTGDHRTASQARTVRVRPLRRRQRSCRAVGTGEMSGRKRLSPTTIGNCSSARDC